MSGLVVEVLFKGKVLQTVPFEHGALRIGRMRENEIVIDNLAVSRFHARLQLVDGHVFFEDSGSENGSFIDGGRVHGRVEINPGDTIAIGKHQLRVRSRHGEAEAAVAKASPPRRSDPWDAAKTYFAGPETRARLLADAEPASAAAKTATPKAVAAPAASPTPPDEPPAPRSARPERREEPSFEPARVGDSIFDLGAPDEAEPVELSPELDDAPPAPALPAVPTSAAEPGEPEIERPREAGRPYAGLIVQRDGKIESVFPWNEELLTVGRSSECDLMLGQDEVSRRHAQFRRAGDRYEVLDLGSVNGTMVNGKRFDRRVLEVGDVIQIEGFQLTFVLDHQPIEGAMKPSAAAAPEVDSRLMTMLQDEALEIVPDEEPQPASDSAHADAQPVDAGRAAPGPLLDAGRAAPGPLSLDAGCAASGPLSLDAGRAAPGPLSLDAGRAAPGPLSLEDGGELELVDSVELEDADADAEEGKPLAAVRPRGSSRASSVQDLGPVADAPSGLVLELRLRLEDLPEALRLALAEAEGEDRVVPAELQLRVTR